MKLIEKISNIYDQVNKFFTEDIWLINKHEASRRRAIVSHQIRITLITSKNFGDNNLGWQSVALSYFSIISFVPMVALIFLITNGFGLAEHLKELLYTFIDNTEILDIVFNISDNIIHTAKEGPYGIISFILFIWLFIWLMLCVEKSFNLIWKVEKARNLWKKMISYITIIFLSPFVIITFLTMIITLNSGASYIRSEIPSISALSDTIIWVGAYILATIAFTLLYKFIPNAKVYFISALKSALISALAFTVIQFLYLETQFMVSRLNAVYGAFAAFPLFLIWLNMGWFIILTGVGLSYAYQKEEEYIQRIIQKKTLTKDE